MPRMMQSLAYALINGCVLSSCNNFKCFAYFFHYLIRLKHTSLLPLRILFYEDSEVNNLMLAFTMHVMIETNGYYKVMHRK